MKKIEKTDEGLIRFQKVIDENEWKQRLIKYKEKINNGEFTADDVPMFIEDISYRTNDILNLEKLRGKLPELRKAFAEYYGCEEEEICIGDANLDAYANLDVNKVPYVAILGNAKFKGTSDIGKLQFVLGTADFDESYIEDLGNLKNIGGSAKFGGPFITDLNQIKSIGGSVEFGERRNQYINIDLGQLQNIGQASKEIPGYIVANDGKLYKCNMMKNGIYYCADNTIIDKGKVIELDPEKQMLIDCYIIDKEKKTIELYDQEEKDSFTDGLKDVKRIEITEENGNSANNRIIKLYKEQANPIEIKIGESNQIIGYTNEELTEIGDDFLFTNIELAELNLPNVTKIGKAFLHSNKRLTELSLPKVTQVGSHFLFFNRILSKLNLPKATHIGSEFFFSNRSLKKLNLPEVTEIKGNFLNRNENLTELILPKVEKIGDPFLYSHSNIKEEDIFNAQKENNTSFSILKAFRKITSKDIAKLDKEKGLTTTEVGKGKGLIENIRRMFNKIVNRKSERDK